MNSRYLLQAAVAAMLVINHQQTLAQSDTPYPQSKGIAIAVTAGHYEYDPAVGVELSSPPMLSANVRLRMKMNCTWLEQYKTTSDHWATFNTYWAGIVYNVRVGDRAKFFVEGGSYNISPNTIFSSKKLHRGYYGAMGVELFVVPNHRENLCYFFSGGFASAHAHADKLEGNPRYGSGMTFTNGLRYYLSR